MRRSTIKQTGGLLLGLGLLAVGVHLACQGEQAPDRHRMTAADIERWMTELSNWGRWEFLLTAAPLPVQGGTGSPLNPIATF